MGEIINLNKVRKAKARADAEKAAAENRAIHGRSKQRRDEADRFAGKAEKELDGKRLED